MLENASFMFEFIDDMPVGIARADTTGELENHFNKYFLSMFGWSKEEIETLEKWFSKAYPDNNYRDQVVKLWNDRIEETENQNMPFSNPMEADVTCKDGSIKTCEVRYYRKEHFIYGIFVDISRRKAVEKMLEQRSFMDPLLNIYNRTFYNKKISDLLSLYKRYQTPFSILMFDIDDFKHINDLYGHSKGDDVLIELSQHIKICIRETDYFFRVGGEEFIILLPETHLDEAKVVAEKVRTGVNDLNIIDKEKITVSIGLYEVQANDTHDLIYKIVDSLLYHSKKSGKDKVSTEK